MSAIENLRGCYIIFPRRGCNPCVHCGSCRVNANYMADEIVAELRGTCQNKERGVWGEDYDGEGFWCSECGFDEPNMNEPDYCPQCGRKVVDDAER